MENIVESLSSGFAQAFRRCDPHVASGEIDVAGDFALLPAIEHSQRGESFGPSFLPKSSYLTDHNADFVSVMDSCGSTF